MISLCRYWSTAKLIKRCSRRPADEQAWQEFVRRFHSTIQAKVVNAFHSVREGEPQLGVLLTEKLKDQLVQNVYQRLVEKQSRLLKEFRCERDDSIYGLLTLISINVVRNYIREEQVEASSNLESYYYRASIAM
jgi:hypothetical protein